VVERIGQANRGGGLAFAGWRRRDRRHQDQFAVLPALQRLNVVHRHLGFVVAIGFEVFRGDAEFFFSNVEDWPLFRGLRNFDVGFWILMLRGGHWIVPLFEIDDQPSRAPAASLALEMNSEASIFLPPSGWTRVTLKRPSAQTTVKLSLSIATISPSLPAIP